MKNFNVFTSNRRKEVAAAAVGAVAVTSLLSGCGEGKDSIFAMPVGERSEIFSGEREPTSARECLLELTQAWLRDAQRLPENHQDPSKIKTYGYAWRDGEDAYMFRIGSVDDTEYPSHDRITVIGNMFEPENLPMEEGDDGIMHFKYDIAEDGTRKRSGFEDKYAMSPTISVPKVEGKTPFEALLDANVDDVIILDQEGPIFVLPDDPVNGKLEEYKTTDVDIFYERELSEYCAVTKEMYDRLD